MQSTLVNKDKNFDYNRLEKVADSVKVENIVIKNLFKHQLLAHKNQQYDSVSIVRNVYLPHKNYGTAAIVLFSGMKMLICSIIPEE